MRIDTRVLPARYEANGRVDAIRRSFRDIAQWRAVSVPETVDTLWVGTRAVQRWLLYLVVPLRRKVGQWAPDPAIEEAS